MPCQLASQSKSGCENVADILWYDVSVGTGAVSNRLVFAFLQRCRIRLKAMLTDTTQQSSDQRNITHSSTFNHQQVLQLAICCVNLLFTSYHCIFGSMQCIKPLYFCFSHYTRINLSGIESVWWKLLPLLLSHIECVWCSYCAQWSCYVACLSLSLTHLHPAETAEWIKVPFVMEILGGRKHDIRCGVLWVRGGVLPRIQYANTAFLVNLPDGAWWSMQHPPFCYYHLTFINTYL